MKIFQILPGPVQGALSLILLFVNTVLCCTALFAATFFKVIVPLGAWRRFWGCVANHIATFWIGMNNLGISLTKKVHWDVRGLSGLSEKAWYLVISNHQSWLDIVVLQKIFHRKIPFLKFFLKKNLIWVPFLGQAWWALDFPFMRRYSRAFLEKHPELRGKDLETTRKACAKFKHIPVSIMNFVEGTRFTPEKAARIESPYANLLKPKAAGIAFVLGAMGENLTSILNVTIAYQEGKKGLWSFMCGRIQKVKVVVEAIPVTPELLGDYFKDHEFQRRFQEWVNEMWDKKDQLLQSMTDRPLAAALEG